MKYITLSFIFVLLFISNCNAADIEFYFDGDVTQKDIQVTVSSHEERQDYDLTSIIDEENHVDISQFSLCANFICFISVSPKQDDKGNLKDIPTFNFFYPYKENSNNIRIEYKKTTEGTPPPTPKKSYDAFSYEPDKRSITDNYDFFYKIRPDALWIIDTQEPKDQRTKDIKTFAKIVYSFLKVYYFFHTAMQMGENNEIISAKKWAIEAKSHQGLSSWLNPQREKYIDTIIADIEKIQHTIFDTKLFFALKPETHALKRIALYREMNDIYLSYDEAQRASFVENTKFIERNFYCDAARAIKDVSEEYRIQNENKIINFCNTIDIKINSKDSIKNKTLLECLKRMQTIINTCMQERGH